MRYWHLAVGLFFLGWIFMYADRTILSPVLGDIESEFGLSGAQLGLINLVFFLTYALMQIPSGALADRIGKKVVLVPGFLIFAIGTALTGLVGKFGWLLGARALTGIGEGTYYSTQYALSSEAIPERRRSLGSAVINSGMAFGISLGFIGSSFVATDLDLGWRASFLIFSIPTAMVAIAIWIFVRDRAGMAEEREESSEGGASIKEILTDKTLLMIYATIFCSLYGFFVILTWLPYFLQEAWGLEGSRVGFIASLVPFAAIPGALFFSSFSDRLSRRKPLALVLLPLAAICIALIVFNQQSFPLLVATLIAYGLVGKLALDPVLVAWIADHVPRRSYATAFGIFNFAGMVSSIIAPYVTGWLADRTGSLSAGFYLAGALLILGMVSMSLAREQKSPVTAPKSRTVQART